jgi:hypothetical protein
VHRHRPPLPCAIALALAIGCGPAAPPAASDPEAVLFRPRLADLRESLIRFRFLSFTEDLRYGTDVADSTSVAGVDRGVRGVAFGIAAGKTFRGPLAARLGALRAPWQRCQLVAPMAVNATFDRIHADFFNVTDYQFGGGLDVLWRGTSDPRTGITDFGRAAVTTRVALLHRSSHVSDDYLGRAGFGRNQQGLVEAGDLSPRPPVKRVVLSHEVLETATSVEWSPRAVAPATVRAYGGGEFLVGISGLQPRRMRSPAGSVGLELRSAGNRADLPPGPLARSVNRALRDPVLATAWFAALDLRLARPFDFASADNPAGTGEVWTPRLWSDCPYGRELRYAGSWHAMVGLALFDPARRDASRGGRLVGRETLVTLEWYRGYSPYGPFLDQRRREHPRWYVAPSLTMCF